MSFANNQANTMINSYSALSRAFFDEFPACKPNSMRSFVQQQMGGYPAFAEWLEAHGVPREDVLGTKFMHTAMLRMGTDEYNRRRRLNSADVATLHDIVHKLRTLVPMEREEPLNRSEQRDAARISALLARMIVKRAKRDRRTANTKAVRAQRAWVREQQQHAEDMAHVDPD